MIIDEDLLLENGAICEDYEPKTILFKEGDSPHYYFQIISGTVELNNYHEDGKEFTFNILSAGQSIGESLLFSDNNYPMNAVVKTRSQILKLPKSVFLDLIRKDQDITLNFFRCLSDRLYYKYIMLFNNSSADPLTKISCLLNYFKGFSGDKGQFTYHVPFTRQQIANLTGLCVETVIRSIKKMEKQNVVRITNRKIYY
ncbi:Crp/Fnr family transcriptional regulator [Chryseobacterium lactis]|uniref:Crp/Fnr family transcriptional regulator n=1 Tax=Chryseobacterium lactis TaxID=1241981 RepID=A0A3G6RRX6_CHRLC|nr:Crp/Fnr family transcriptional regulator [Chryseobacterium lactis]AZA84406.1 Crp/Fnr family transcriptional regulator [Chryseobacterium lactis]AZB04794.1 Crp/Fnr family transcriptional regulator [Chryseobacterium lactis]PNW14525.1 Crp/Fnr family transcriptional regulator [Chryseobacterium lactis]